MKKYLIAGATLLFAIACKKGINEANPDSLINGGTASGDTAVISIIHSDSSVVRADTPKTQQATFPDTPSSACFTNPIYGDTILFPQPTYGQDYVVSPSFNPGPGKYLSWPLGMVIDSITGAIDVTQTESGLRYKIGYIKSGTTDTCISELIIGGVDYMDSVYVLANGAYQALPYFNANPAIPSPCITANACSFDVTGSAAKAKVIVDPNTGIIDLQKTADGTGLFGGAFGLLPVNGSTVTVPIYYKLKDASNSALQMIPVQLLYYDNYDLLSTGLLGNIIVSLDNIFNNNTISTYANPRPPLIVVVRR